MICKNIYTSPRSRCTWNKKKMFSKEKGYSNDIFLVSSNTYIVDHTHNKWLSLTFIYCIWRRRKKIWRLRFFFSRLRTITHNFNLLLRRRINSHVYDIQKRKEMKNHSPIHTLPDYAKQRRRKKTYRNPKDIIL